jgi:hypothetical protein
MLANTIKMVKYPLILKQSFLSDPEIGFELLANDH